MELLLNLAWLTVVIAIGAVSVRCWPARDRRARWLSLGALLCAAVLLLSHDIGSDSQRPFAIVIVGGLIVELVVSIILLPSLYVFWARPGDTLPPSEAGFFGEGEHVD
jgi:hypothetical protein